MAGHIVQMWKMRILAWNLQRKMQLGRWKRRWWEIKMFYTNRVWKCELDL